MIYQTINWLFGWDYIQWDNFSDSGIARIHIDGMGRVWYWRYKILEFADYVNKPEDVLWLTCNPNKYFPETKGD